MFSDKQKQIMIAAGFFVLLIGGGLGYFQYMMGSQAIIQWKADAKKAKDESKEFDAKIAEFKQLKSRENEILGRKADVEKLAKRMSEPEESQFYVILAEIMDQANVFPIKVEKLKTSPREFYTEIPFRVECFVKYHNMGEFFNLIEENPTRFMRIKQFNITDESPILQDRPSVQYASIEIATYSYNPKARLKPPKPAATPAKAAAAPKPAGKQPSEKME